jgi:hypothetical protein
VDVALREGALETRQRSIDHDAIEVKRDHAATERVED